MVTIDLDRIFGGKLMCNRSEKVIFNKMSTARIWFMDKILEIIYFQVVTVFN